MSKWADGYVAEIEYAQGMYREMTPGILRLALAMRQIRPDGLSGRPFAYAELGCGHGTTATMIAAAYPQAQVHATDFNPAHIAGARRLAEAAALKNLHLYERSFAEFIDEDMPDFDVIALHGIYSWVSPESRRDIVDFLYRKLKPGGVCYVSYNTLPGWNAIAPLRKLMTEHAAGQTGKPLAGRLDSAIELLTGLQKTGAKYFVANPTATPRLEKLAEHNRNYLAHEYLNEHWTLFYHSDVVRELAEAKLVFAASAHLGDHVDVVNLTADQQQLMAGISDAALRETVRDFYVNQQFRRDIFVKGAQTLSPQEQGHILGTMRFALTVPRGDVTLKASFPIGEVTLQADIYEPLADALKDNPRSLAELLANEPLKSLGYHKVLQALTILTAGGQAGPALDEKQVREAKPGCDRLNAAFQERARYSADILYHLSPVTGNGVQVDRFAQLFLLARRQNQKDLSAFIWQILAAQGQRIVQDGKALETPEQNLAELKKREQVFLEKTLPLLTYLGIA